MPIRFQVDPDFYDHPKTLGMSDAAISLWVRAGSYSAAKSTDGFVSEDVLVQALRSTVQVAEELVLRGMWRRRKGGFLFHEWDSRNLTKERIEADRKSDRERKRESRNKQVNGHFVRPESERNPEGIQAESPGNPGASVSVSLSVSKDPPSPPRGKRGSRRRAYDYDEDPDFQRFWAEYPEKAGKAAAFGAWQQAVARGTNPEVMIEAAARYRDDPRRNPNKTKYPQGWLNDARFLDEAASTNGSSAPTGWWDN